jgi:hypothetical protein
MKIILSRKGYDSENGGHPSPILPDGRMISLPIPSSSDEWRYSDLHDEDGARVCTTVQDLDLFDDGIDARCHLDPDLGAWAVAREAGWKAGFGQLDQAATHLDNQGIGAGDVFLFFGWFRRTESVDGKLRYLKGQYRDLHVLFGWLQVGEIMRPQPGVAVPAWLASHPHCVASRRTMATNRIYIASERLSFAPSLPGAGVFRFADKRVLTKPGMTRSRWALDRAIFGDTTISYHDARSWKDDHFRSAAKGQEFVLEANEPILAWLRHVVAP